MRGYRALWASVIFSALVDAQKVPEANTGETLLSIYESREYITSYSAGLREVCEMAGIHYNDVLKKGLALQEQGWCPQSRKDWGVLVAKKTTAHKEYLSKKKKKHKHKDAKNKYLKLKALCSKIASTMEPPFLNLTISEDNKNE